MSKLIVKVEGGEKARKMFRQSFDYAPMVKIQRAIHLGAGYLSVSGLGFMFACLLLGAVEYLLPLAIFMVFCAVVSILSKPRVIALNLDDEGL